MMIRQIMIRKSDKMFKLEKVTKLVIINVLLLACIALGAGIYFVSSPYAYLKGIAFGTIMTILRMILIERSTKKALDMDKARSTVYFGWTYLIRYIITGVVLVVAALQPDHINIWGVIIGLLLLKPAAYIVKIRERKSEKENFETGISKSEMTEKDIQN